MITDKGIDYARRVDAYMTERYDDRYTLRVTHWNDEDFRIMAYVVLSTDGDALPDAAEKLFYELWYQDSKCEDGVAMGGRTAQDSELPRTDTEQYNVDTPDLIDLPEVAA